MAKLDAEIAPLAIRIEKSVEKQRAQRLGRDDLKRAIAENGGDRIERIKSEVAAKTREKNDRLRRAQSYDALARTVELSPAADEEAFSANSHAIIAKKESNAVLQAEKQNALTESAVTFRRLDEERRELLAERFNRCASGVRTSRNVRSTCAMSCAVRPVSSRSAFPLRES